MKFLLQVKGLTSFFITLIHLFFTSYNNNCQDVCQYHLLSDYLFQEHCQFSLILQLMELSIISQMFDFRKFEIHVIVSRSEIDFWTSQRWNFFVLRNFFYGFFFLLFLFSPSKDHLIVLFFGD